MFRNTLLAAMALAAYWVYAIVMCTWIGILKHEIRVLDSDHSLGFSITHKYEHNSESHEASRNDRNSTVEAVFGGPAIYEKSDRNGNCSID
jgi:hypothetical protein